MADEQKMVRLETREIATTNDGRDITRGFIDYLKYILPQDRVLRLRGSRNYEVYEDVLRDSQVKATFNQRRLAVVSHPVEVLAGGSMRRDRMAAEHLEEVLKHIRWDTVTEKMLYGRFYGYSVAEALWVRDGRHVALDRLAVRNRRRFVFDPEFRLKLLTTSNPDGEELPDRKFWVLSTGADHDDEPYGLGLAHWLYWPVFFKRNQMKFWLIASEKFGSPTVIGKYPRSASEPEVEKLEAAVKAVRTDSGITAPDDVIIELLEQARSGRMDYAGLYDRLDQAISKIVVGQTMTADDGSSRSQAEVHLEVRGDLVRSDEKLISDSFNRSIGTWLTDWNYPGAAYPIVKRTMEEEEDLKALSDRDKTISEMTGKVPEDKYIEETYNIRMVDKPTPDEPPAGMPPGPPSPGRDDADLAEGDSLPPLEQALDAIDGEDWQTLAKPLVKPILDQAMSDPESLMTDLAELYPELDTDAIEAQLTRVIFVADAWGRLSGQDDA